MTTVSVIKKAGHIVEFTLSGHTGAGERGSDIVCAALSAVSQTALLGLTRVIKAPVKFERDDENTDNEDVRRRTDDVLNTMLCGIKDMAEGYPQFIKLEVKNHVY